MSDQVQDVQLSGDNNTLVAIALVIGVLSLALNFYAIQRINENSTVVAIMMVNAVKAK